MKYKRAHALQQLASISLMNSTYHSTIPKKSSANHAHTQFHVGCDREESGLLLVWFQRENYNDVTVS